MYLVLFIAFLERLYENFTLRLLSQIMGPIEKDLLRTKWHLHSLGIRRAQGRGPSIRHCLRGHVSAFHEGLSIHRTGG